MKTIICELKSIIADGKDICQKLQNCTLDFLKRNDLHWFWNSDNLCVVPDEG